MFNEEQRSYMKELDSIPLEDLCYCGWYKRCSPTIGYGIQCSNCPPHLSCADKMRLRYKSCGNYPHFSQIDLPFTHNITCKLKHD